MKKNSKIISLVLAVVLVFGMLATTALAAGAAAEPTEGGPEIISQNIAYQGTFGLIYAVDAATVKGGSVTVNVYDDGMNFLASYTSSKTEDITPANSEPTLVYVVQTNAVAAKDMGDVFYAQAVDAQGNAGALKSYSVAEYLYERLYANGVYKATEGVAFHQKEFYENTLAMGASAQTVLINDKLAEGATPETLVTALNYVYVENGFFNGVSTKLSTEAFSVTPTFDESCGLLVENKWNVTRFVDGALTTETVAGGTEVSVSGTVIITPVYTDATGDYYNNYDITGTRINYDAENAALPTADLGGSEGSRYTALAIKDGTLVFNRTENAGEGYLRWNVPTSTTNKVLVFEADMKLHGFTQGTTVGKINLQVSGKSIQLNVTHSGDDVTFAGVGGGSVGIKENTQYNIRFEYYTEDGTVNVFVDNNYAGTLTPTVSSSGSSRVLFYLLKSGYDGVVEMDNIFYGLCASGTAIPESEQ